MRGWKRPARLLRITLCCLLVLCALPMTAQADHRPMRTVRVGFFAFDGYHMTDDAGVRSGYGYELLQHMAGYTDWAFEYVGYDKSWADMPGMLARGEIDLLTSAQMTNDRRASFDFSERSIGTSCGMLTIRAGDERYLRTEPSRWSGMRVGMLRGNSRNKDFALFAQQQGFTYESVFFDDIAALREALMHAGGIDAVVTSSLRAIDGERILAKFADSPFHIMVRKGDSQMLSAVNDALDRLFLDEPELPAQLMAKYYTPSSGEEIAFTAEERAFIDAGHAFTAVINPDRPPFSSCVNGGMQGIAYDIAQEIIRRSGLDITILPITTREEYKRAVATRGADIRFDAWYDYDSAEKSGYRLTAPYLDIAVSKLRRRDNVGFDSVALLDDTDMTGKNLHVYQAMYGEIAYYDDLQQMVDAVLAGKRDAAYLYSLTAEYAVRYDATKRLVAETRFGYESAFAVAVDARQDSLLFSILNKSVASISREDVAAIVRRYTVYEEIPMSLVGYIISYPFISMGVMLGLFLLTLFVLLFCIADRRRKREALQLAEEKRAGDLLRTALAAAERADTAKSQFLSRVSHEMRTPLNAIIGFLSLARDADDKQTRFYLSNSELAARQLLSVINDVLDMSSIEAGKMKLANAPFDVRHLLGAITNIYTAQCQQKGLEYETRLLTPIDEWLIGDQLRVNQILINLLGNAVKFTASGHVYLTVSQTDKRDGRVFLRFEVSDTGRGISPDMQKRLFKPFEQSSSATAQKYGGSGLGLSIVKNLVNMMNGAIRVDSTPGAGTTFTVDLPFLCGEVMSRLSDNDSIRDLHVLAVDDEDMARGYIASILERIGVRYECVPNGSDALLAISRARKEGDPFTICLIDWKMPNMNGVETTRRIREKFGEDIIIIIMSAYEHQQANDSARKAGADLFVSKPLFQSSLVDLFMTLTGGRMLSGSPGAAQQSGIAGRRVLLAEDNAMNRLVAEGLMEKFGMHCDSAPDGASAVDMFNNSPPGHYHAILMDIQMPRMDGFEATRRIRTGNHPDALTVPIIALTANAFTEDITKALSCGMNDHVAKPVEPEALARALNKAFRLSPPPDA